MKKLNITKKHFNESKYFQNKYGKLEYVSESGKIYKTDKGQLIKFVKESRIDLKLSEILSGYSTVPDYYTLNDDLASYFDDSDVTEESEHKFSRTEMIRKFNFEVNGKEYEVSFVYDKKTLEVIEMTF